MRECFLELFIAKHTDASMPFPHWHRHQHRQCSLRLLQGRFYVRVHSATVSLPYLLNLQQLSFSSLSLRAVFRRGYWFFQNALYINNISHIFWATLYKYKINIQKAGHKEAEVHQGTIVNAPMTWMCSRGDCSTLRKDRITDKFVVVRSADHWLLVIHVWFDPLYR